MKQGRALLNGEHEREMIRDLGGADCPEEYEGHSILPIELSARNWKLVVLRLPEEA